MKNVKLFLTMMLSLAAVAAGAQNITVRGTITDASTGDVVPAATVQVKGTTNGGFADLDGKYTISAPTDGVLVIANVGYKTQEVKVQGRAEIYIALEPDAAFLDAVVVTALGISRSEKTIGYSATTVKGDEITSARTTNVADALSGKVAGVQVQSTSTDPGSTSNVVIRGFSSIGGSNQPLYIVDGVPLTSTTVFSASADKGISAGGISNIAPEDIESMTVLKGAAATALYGSRAANGVIVVTTKSGSKGFDRPFQIQYSGGVQLRQVATLPTMQNQFGQGWNGTQTYIENGSWGAALDGSTQVYGPIWNHSQRIHEYSAKEKNVMEFFDLGVSQNHNISFSGASDDNKMTYYMSYSYTGDDGIMPSDADSFTRNTVAFSGSYAPVKWLKVSSSVNFATSRIKTVDTDQGTSVIDGLYEFPRDISIVDLADLSNPFNTPEAYLTPYGITNPYWALANNYDTTNSKQIHGKAQIDIKPWKWLTLTYRAGMDYTDYEHKIGYPQISLDDKLIDDDMGYAPSNMNQSGWVSNSFGRRYEINHDFLLTYDNSFLDDKLSLTAIAGLNINERASSAMGGQVDNLTFDTGFWDFSNGADKTSITESAWKRRLIGLFADVTLGYNDEVFLDLTARNDWSSTLPINANSYFYPGATLSWIFSKRIPENNVLNFGKLRLAYGMTGNDADVYKINETYTQAYANGYYYSDIASFPMNGVNSFISAATKGSATLRPEMTSEFEVGTKLEFFDSRIGLDLTYYDRKTTDQIFTLPVDPATGYQNMVTNFGTVTNRGIELMVDFVPVRTRDFVWDVTVNFAKNWNNVVSLPDGLENGRSTLGRFSAGNDAVYMYAEVGKPLGTIYTYLPTYNEKGQLVVGEDGMPLLNTDKVQYTGKSAQADWTGGINTSLSWKGLTLSAVLDVRMGGYMFSRTKNLMQFTGNGIATLYNDRKPFVIPNSVYEDGTPNSTPIYLNNSSYQTYFNDYGAGLGGEFYLLDRSYAKLRNVSLTYNLPAKWMKAIKFTGMSVSLFCNNAFTWTAKDNYYIDPDVSSYSYNGDLAAQFGELYSNPACRIWGCNLTVKF